MRKKVSKQIYLLQHKYNQDWVYVGATKQKLYEIKRDKLSDARRGIQKGPVYRAMQQDSDRKSWTITQLHDFTEHWEQLEAAFIRLFNSYECGLNGTADGQRDWRKSQPIATKASVVACSKPVTNGITCYASASVASRATGIDRPSITACCLGKRKTAGGFAWQYAV